MQLARHPLCVRFHVRPDCVGVQLVLVVSGAREHAAGRAYPERDSNDLSATIMDTYLHPRYLPTSLHTYLISVGTWSKICMYIHEYLGNLVCRYATSREAIAAAYRGIGKRQVGFPRSWQLECLFLARRQAVSQTCIVRETPVSPAFRESQLIGRWSAER